MASSAHRMSSLYVGDLHPGVSELMLMNKFSPFGPILSTRVCRDRNTWQSLRYGYVNFANTADAEQAMNILMFDLLMGRPMRIMWAQRSPELRNSGVGNIYIQGLAENIDSLALYDTFSHFGTILSCKVVCDEHGSRGYGYVHYATHDAAETAIKTLDGMLLNDRQVSICHYKSFRERQAGISAQKHFKRSFPGVNLYVKNLPYSWTDRELYGVFSPFGCITSAKVMIKNGCSKGFGFVCFESPESAAKAIAVMNGRVIGNRCLSVALSRPRDQDVQETGDFNEAPLPVENPSEPPLPSGVFSDVLDVPQAHSSVDEQPDNQLAQIEPSRRQEAEDLLTKCESLLISPLLLETASAVLPHMLASPAPLDYKVKEELPEPNPIQPPDVSETSATCSAVSPFYAQENRQLGKGLVSVGNESRAKIMVIMDGTTSRMLICPAEDTTMTFILNHEDVLPQSDLLHLLTQSMAEFMLMSVQSAESLLERSTSEHQSSPLRAIQDVPPDIQQDVQPEWDLLHLLSQNKAEFRSGQSAASLLERSASKVRSNPLQEIHDVQPEYDQEEPETTKSSAARTVRPVFTVLTQKLASLHMATQTLHILPEDPAAKANTATGPQLGSSEQSQRLLIGRSEIGRSLWGPWLKTAFNGWRSKTLSCPTSRNILSLSALRRFQL